MDATRFVECPRCGVPAEVTEVVLPDSTDGPFAHERIRCALGDQRVSPVQLRFDRWDEMS